jgi:Ca-activated chloride channel family protein
MVNRMRDSPSKTKVAILISDGDNTAGNIDPVTAAQLSQVYGIKLYTIVVGTEGRLPYKDKSGQVKICRKTP